MNSELAFLVGHDLAVYSSRTCPDCSRLDRWMQSKDVAHRKVYIDEDAAAADKLENETGKQAVPFILVDGKKWVRGYHKEERSRLSEALLLAELREAMSAR
ncbi:MAG: glutaredoxin family protein [Planctomycetota bacterium]|nr:glutaredoxin family protein [Planctomycetota bacterium]